MIRIIITVLILSVCIGIQAQTDAGQKTATKTEFIESDFFEIAKIDYQGNWLQRIFVVIDSSQVNDTAVIRNIICELQKHYPLNNKSSISFFSDKKYANYKDELFFDEKTKSLPKSEYPNWMNFYYLGEFDFETWVFQTFPSSYKRQHKTYKIKGCP